MSLLMKKRQLESQRSNGLNDPAVKPQQQPSMTNQNSSSNFWSTAVNNENQSGFQVTPHPCPHPSVMNMTQCRPPRSHYREQSAPIESLLQHTFAKPIRPKSNNADHVTPAWSVPSNSMNTSSPYEGLDFQEKISPETMKALNLPEGAYFEAPVYIDPATGNPIVVDAEHFKSDRNVAENVGQHNGITESDWSKCA